jgi:hypothetical protein
VFSVLTERLNARQFKREFHVVVSRKGRPFAPVGLAAAAHLRVRNQPFILFEAGSTVGANILSWKHIRVFSPRKYNIDKAARALLSETNWKSPDDEGLPTGGELYGEYFKPLSELPSIKPNIHVSAKVTSIGRKNIDKMKTWGRDEVPYVVQVLPSMPFSN